MSESTDNGHSAAKKKRGHFIEMPRPHEDYKPPLWKRPLGWLLALIALLLALPALRVGWNIVRPDAPKPAATSWPDYSPIPPDKETPVQISAGELGTARAEAALLRTLPAAITAKPEILSGSAYDSQATPALIKAYIDAAAVDGENFSRRANALMKPPFTTADIAAADGLSRACAADARAKSKAGELAEVAFHRLQLADDLTALTSTADDFAEALRHKRAILAEIRADAPLIITADKEAFGILLRALAVSSQAPDKELASSSAQAFDAALDAKPDALLRLETAPGKASGFLRLALAARKPNEHRRRVSELHRQFGEALAKHTFREALRALPEPGDIQAVRLGSLLLRAEVFRKAPGDVAEEYFFQARPPVDGIELFALKFTALAGVEDPYGEALLLRRHAMLTKLLALRDRTRFETAATAFALALEYRRAANPEGKWPASTESIFDGLLEGYPQDPFADDTPAYSRKNLTLHSPGADGTDLGGIPEPEFATEMAQLWEPTIPLVTEHPIDPKAFGLKPSDLDFPVVRQPTVKKQK